MKLHCEKHMRRVMVLTGFKVIHRSDGSHCSTVFVEIGDNVFTEDLTGRAQSVMDDFIESFERDC